MPQNNAVKKDEAERVQYSKKRLSSDSFSLGRNLSDRGANREMSAVDGGNNEDREEGAEEEEGRDGKEGEGERGFNPQEEANRLEADREREREENQKSGEEGLPAQTGKEGEEGEDEGEEKEGEGVEEEKITIPSEISAFVVQWEFVFALAGPFFLFILLAEFIALRIFSMFKFSKWKKICTLGNFLLSCLTTLIYFLFIMMLVAALQKTGPTTIRVVGWGVKAWSGITSAGTTVASFFGF